ncbi:hypothetical protein D3C84_1092310 [compost metagenome]
MQRRTLTMWRQLSQRRGRSGHHGLLIGTNGVLINEHETPCKYQTEEKMMWVYRGCFGGVPDACEGLANRDLVRIFDKASC